MLKALLFVSEPNTVNVITDDGHLGPESFRWGKYCVLSGK